MNTILDRSAKIVEDWTLWEYESVASTNLVAAGLPAWSAVRAETQSAGRGRFQRQWVSDRGGLWLSAVVPTASPNCPLLPLLAGLAVCDVLRGLGVRNLRLRWPNNVLVRDRKLAGVLIDQFKPGLAVIGIGLNIDNQPADYDAALQNQIQRLADLLPARTPIEDLTTLLLRQIRSLVQRLNAGDFEPLARARQCFVEHGPPRGTGSRWRNSRWPFCGRGRRRPAHFA